MLDPNIFFINMFIVKRILLSVKLKFGKYAIANSKATLFVSPEVWSAYQATFDFILIIIKIFDMAGNEYNEARNSR